ncbi:MAG: hypothetical protein NVS4B3_16270 [Gemmatimonadaceae bacterium]
MICEPAPPKRGAIESMAGVATAGPAPESEWQADATSTAAVHQRRGSFMGMGGKTVDGVNWSVVGVVTGIGADTPVIE